MSLVAAYCSSDEESSENETTIPETNPQNDLPKNLDINNELEENGNCEDDFYISDDEFEEDLVNPSANSNHNIGSNVVYDSSSVISMMAHLPVPKSSRAAVDEEDIRRESEIQHQEQDVLEDIVKPTANELSLRVVAAKGKRKGKHVIMAPSLISDEDIPASKKMKKGKNSSGRSFLNSLPAPSQTHELKARQSSAAPTSIVAAGPAPPSDDDDDVIAPSLSHVTSPPRSGAKPQLHRQNLQPIVEQSEGDSDSDEGDLQGPCSFFTFASADAECSDQLQQVDQSAVGFDAPKPSPSARDRMLQNMAVHDVPYPEIEPLEPGHQLQDNSAPLEPTNNDYRYLSDPKLPVPISTIDKEDGVELGEQELQRLHGRHKAALRPGDMVTADASVVRGEISETMRITQQEPFADGATRQQNKFEDKVSKHKHHITYLAHMAKEREFDLKNQWSSDRNKRRQTKSKYGF